MKRKYGTLFALMRRDNETEKWGILTKFGSLNDNSSISDEAKIDYIKTQQMGWHSIFPEYEYGVALIKADTCRAGFEKLIKFV